MAQSTAINQFDQTFKLNQGRMNLHTVYNKDFNDLSKTDGQRQHKPPVKREEMEGRHRKMLTERFPMESITQHKLDFKSYDPEVLTSASLGNFNHVDLFKSGLRKNLNPRRDEDNPMSPKTSSTDKFTCDSSNSTHRNNRNIVILMFFFYFKDENRVKNDLI